MDNTSTAANVGEVAFAKLVGKTKSFLVTTPSVALGRETSSVDPAAPEPVLGIGQAKNISRRHAVISWDAADRQWKITCIGKNGMEVDGQFFATSSPRGAGPTNLRDRAKIQIEDEVFFFLLPDTGRQ